MNNINGKEMLDVFSERLKNNFAIHCDENLVNDNRDSFVSYLIDRGLISSNMIKRYAILEAFEELQKNHRLLKTHAVAILAKRFNVSERSIWNVLKTGK